MYDRHRPFTRCRTPHFWRASLECTAGRPQNACYTFRTDRGRAPPDMRAAVRRARWAARRGSASATPCRSKGSRMSLRARGMSLAVNRHAKPSSAPQIKSWWPPPHPVARRTLFAKCHCLALSACSRQESATTSLVGAQHRKLLVLSQSFEAVPCGKSCQGSVSEGCTWFCVTPVSKLSRAAACVGEE